MIIRPALASDAAAVEALFQEFVAYLRSVGDQEIYRFGRDKFLADGFGPDPAFRGIVADDASEVVGYALFSRAYEGDYVRSLYVVDLFVRHDARGRGLGRMLMDAVQATARNEGITRLSWSVHKGNADALRFYEALGAQVAVDTRVMYLDLA